MIYFTSDLHFNHDRAFIYEPRGFKTVDEMNETLIKNWNETISPYDSVYILGDFFLGTDKEYIHKAIDRLNGTIHLIIGNHDTPAKLNEYKETKVIVEGYADILSYKKQNFYLSHYPTLTATLESNPDRAIINLFGHTHSKEKFYEDRPYMYNVSVDANDNRPVDFQTIKERISAEIEKCYSYLK